MNIKKALAYGRNKLISKSSTPILDSEILLSFVLKKPKEFFYTYPEKNITKVQENKFKTLLKRRSKHEPIAYITGHKEFYGLDFKIDKRVLIPRPETELIVDEILKQNQESRIKNQVIADVGTGSGCIAITLAKHLPKAKIIATDISKKALTVAKQNAKIHKIKINFIHGDLLEPIMNKRVDLIIANLPYGWKQWKNNTSADTKGLIFEPPEALFTKKDGLYLYNQLFNQVSKLKQKPRLIIGEFDPRQKSKLQKLIKKNLPNSQVEIKKDLAGLDRIIIVKL